MTRDDILLAMKEVGAAKYDLMPKTYAGVVDVFERFCHHAAAVERDKWEAKFKQLEALMQVREQQPNKPCCLAEREACAKVCEAEGQRIDASWQSCAAAIRARGQE